MEPSDLVILFDFLHEEILDSHLQGKKDLSYSLYFPSSTPPHLLFSPKICLLLYIFLLIF